jgi:hypothetical protein|tara:strand:- start:187 stop:405 length:219 start_codon:yes stop_codon:yes gene_type:complete
MVTLQETLEKTHHWALDRIDFLCDKKVFDDDVITAVEDAYALRQEFNEWIDASSAEDIEVFSLQYINDEDFD